MVLLIDGVEDKNMALILSHRDAHALHSSLLSLQGIADVDFLPAGLDKAETH
jgi:hypothetical protein